MVDRSLSSVPPTRFRVPSQHFGREAVPSTEGREAMTKTILLAFLAVALLTAVAVATYRSLAGLRDRRRTAWELERAEWRLWISRP
jgi:hypothetical protein